MRPVDAAQWWDSLTPRKRETVALTHGAEIGSLDGIPASIRDRANRSSLAGRKAELVRALDRTAVRPRRDAAAARRLDELSDKLAGLRAIEHRLAAPRPRAYLLHVSTRGTGQAIIAVGDPDTAVNVATFVPGVQSRLGTVGDDIGRVDAIALEANAGSPSTSVIAWVGYRAPQSIIEAMSSRFAAAAKADFARFQNGLRVTHKGVRPRTAVIGYSYGALVIGQAATHAELSADEIVFVGSPGVGVESAGQLRLAGIAQHDVPFHVHVVLARNDMVRAFASIHGVSPARARFGGMRLMTTAGGAARWHVLSRAAHLGYFDTGSVALANIVAVITDRSGQQKVAQAAASDGGPPKRVLGANDFRAVEGDVLTNVDSEGRRR